jgi:putative membrane protein
MSLIAKLLVALVAAIHVFILVVEMFFWNTPYGHRAFALTPDFAAQTVVMAANQGLYNGFLAAGLIWSLIAPRHLAFPLKVFFLGCVVVAGLYGAATAKTSILFVQALPAALALAAVFVSRERA